MWEWSDKLKLGKSSAFVKRDIRALPQTEAEFEADFFLDSKFSTEGDEASTGVVIEREHGFVLALENVQLPPPTVNCLANLLAHAMLRPQYGDHRRPSTVYLRDRPQWQELLPHLRQLGIEVVLSEELPKFDEAVIEWMQEAKKPPSPDKLKATLRKPFPERKRTWFTEAMELMEWTEAMYKGVYPSRKVAVPAYDPATIVPICLAADDLEAILTTTEIAKTKKLRPRLEAMAAENKTIELDLHDWYDVVSSLWGSKVDKKSTRRHLLGIARTIANQMAESLGIDPPPLSVD
jgi:hypothetical protein